MRPSLLLIATMFLVTACAGLGRAREPTPLAAEVDLHRFMGDWYVIAFIPIFPERHAHNAVESYRLAPDGRIETTYRFRDGSFDAPLTTHAPTGFVVPGTRNAVWGMQFIWPFKGEYRIAHLEPDYSATIVARNKRDYVWLMARTPRIDDAAFDRYRDLIGAMGYDLAKLRAVPQRWPETEPRPAIE
jgi:apolipoprotein D and lipocalin family protein